jgi:hypothetical protein
MRRVFIGHSQVDRSMRSQFPEHRDVLAAIPSGLREVRRVFGGAPFAVAHPRRESSAYSRRSWRRHVAVIWPEKAQAALGYEWEDTRASSRSQR